MQALMLEYEMNITTAQAMYYYDLQAYSNKINIDYEHGNKMLIY